MSTQRTTTAAMCCLVDTMMTIVSKPIDFQTEWCFSFAFNRASRGVCLLVDWFAHLPIPRLRRKSDREEKPRAHIKDFLNFSLFFLNSKLIIEWNFTCYSCFWQAIERIIHEWHWRCWRCARTNRTYWIVMHVYAIERDKLRGKECELRVGK